MTHVVKHRWDNSRISPRVAHGVPGRPRARIARTSAIAACATSPGSNSRHRAAFTVQKVPRPLRIISGCAVFNAAQQIVCSPRVIFYRGFGILSLSLQSRARMCVRLWNGRGARGTSPTSCARHPELFHEQCVRRRGNSHTLKIAPKGPKTAPNRLQFARELVKNAPKMPNVQYLR